MSAKPPARPRIARLLTTPWLEALTDRNAAEAEIATTPMNDLLNALFHLAEEGTDLIYMVIAWNKASSRMILSEWIGKIGQTGPFSAPWGRRKALSGRANRKIVI